ncbi:hypothetical protein QP016_12545, partial [Gallibacterium anatis]
AFAFRSVSVYSVYILLSFLVLSSTLRASLLTEHKLSTFFSFSFSLSLRFAFLLAFGFLCAPQKPFSVV